MVLNTLFFFLSSFWFYLYIYCMVECDKSPAHYLPGVTARNSSVAVFSCLYSVSFILHVLADVNSSWFDLACVLFSFYLVLICCLIGRRAWECVSCWFDSATCDPAWRVESTSVQDLVQHRLNCFTTFNCNLCLSPSPVGLSGKHLFIDVAVAVISASRVISYWCKFKVVLHLSGAAPICVSSTFLLLSLLVVGCMLQWRFYNLWLLWCFYPVILTLYCYWSWPSYADNGSLCLIQTVNMFPVSLLMLSNILTTSLCVFRLVSHLNQKGVALSAFNISA